MSEKTFIVSKTFEVWSEDDLEAGETYNRGFVFEDEEMEEAELADLIKNQGFCYGSSWPMSRPSDWVSREGWVSPVSGDERVESLHVKDIDWKEFLSKHHIKLL